LSRYKNLLQRFIHLGARQDGATFWGACGAIRRSALAAVGGFDERFDRPSVEDIDLGYRLTNAGFRIVFSPALEVTHLKTWTLASLLESDILRRALPWTWLLMREAGIRRDLNLRYRHRVAGVLACLLFLSIPIGAVQPLAWAIAVACATLLVAIDHRLWSFFRAHGGVAFATAGLAWHWVYYAYSTVAFAAGVLLYPFVGRRIVGDEGRRAALG
jgi:GT2 family glycosyltransferase